MVRHFQLREERYIFITLFCFNADFTDFIGAVEKRGFGAMEMVAMEMKHRGMYVVRQLPLKDVEFRVERVDLSPKFIKSYNDSVKLWVQLFQSFTEAVKLMNVDLHKCKIIWSQFCAAHLRFFQCMAIASKVANVIQAAKKAFSLPVLFALQRSVKRTGNVRLLQKATHFIFASVS
jgi:hypothetical protein